MLSNGLENKNHSTYAGIMVFCLTGVGQKSMTAEIAILNKLAVALATDSAVTISAGKQEQKIYDSADKLFDLSPANPIGIMIYNGMQFMQAPLPLIISEYRLKCREFLTVRDAAQDFLKFLNEWAAGSPEPVVKYALVSVIEPALEIIQSNITNKINDIVREGITDDIGDRVKQAVDEIIGRIERNIELAEKSDFVGGAAPRITKARKVLIRSIVSDFWNTEDDQLIDRLADVAAGLLLVKVPSPNYTGIVIAGYGSAEKFPSLISFKIDGVVFDRLKFIETDFVDIDRAGDRARVIPFAQSEMVERFLFGLDSTIQKDMERFVKETVPEIRTHILSQLDMSDEDKDALTKKARVAEQAFVDGLKSEMFEEIRSSYRSEIEGMVEFMPKPELAKMAEALINLTSIKRRVSRGMETVGGPIDVAVISKTEGFIWVKRKHYFSPELNPRYLSRIKMGEFRKEESNGSQSEV